MNLVCPGCGATNRVPEARLKNHPVCGKCRALLMAAEPVALTDAVFSRFVANTGLPVRVDFWADWCGPCKMMAPHFANAAARLPDVRFAKVDTEANPQASAPYAIRSIPTLILFDGGKASASLATTPRPRAPSSRRPASAPRKTWPSPPRSTAAWPVAWP